MALLSAAVMYHLCRKAYRDTILQDERTYSACMASEFHVAFDRAIHKANQGSE